MAFLALLAFVAAGVAGATIYLRTREPYRGYGATEQFVEIAPRSSTRAIGDALVSTGVVRDRLTYRLAVLLSGQARGLKAGEYRFDHPMTPLEVLDKIARGDVYSIAVTFPEGRTIAEMAAIAEAHGLGPAGAFVEAAKDKSLVHALDPLAQERWRTSTIRPGKAAGRLLGGNLSVLAALVGTPWLPDFAGAILFLEDFRQIGLGQVDRQLTHLIRAGALRHVRGVAVGRFAGFDGLVDRGWSLDDVLADSLDALGVPVLGGLPIGPGERPVPVGVPAVLNAAAGTLTVTAAADAGPVGPR